MSKFKKIAKKILIAISSYLIIILTKSKIGRLFCDYLISQLFSLWHDVSYAGIRMKFVTPNSLNYWRALTFASKEPETLEWIDGIEANSILWDVGANVGLYSIYAALARKCRVFAFEPSVFNLEILARNSFINKVSSQITIIPIPLSDKISINELRYTTTGWGGALSTFGKTFGWDGNPIQEVFSVTTLGLSMDSLVGLGLVDSPNYIKMDVDGLEHIILSGGKDVLKSVKGIIIEINDDFSDQAIKAKEELMSAGLCLSKKLHSELIEQSTAGFKNTYNQVWVRQ